MSATQAQVTFVAEFVLFLASLAGTAVLVLRPGLLVEGRRARWAMTAGLLAVGAAAFAHGSLLEPDASAMAVVLPRLCGLLLVGGATFARRPTRVTHVLRLAATAVAVAEVLVAVNGAGTPTDLLRMAGAVGLTGTILFVARGSIPARVAASAAGTVLLVVLAVSVTLSTVVVDNVRKEVLNRTQSRARAEAAGAVRAPASVSVRATSVAELIVDRARGNPAARDLLVALAEAPTSPAGRDAAAQLATSLEQLGNRPDLVSVGGLLAFITPAGKVVPGAGLPTGSGLAQLGFLGVVQDAITNRVPTSAPELLNRTLLALAAAPVQFDTPAGPKFVGVVVTADTVNDAYLRQRAVDDDQLSLALVGRDGILATAGAQPPSSVLQAVTADALRSAANASRTTDGRFIAAYPVLRGAEPLVAIVASAPSLLADQTRQSLFRTLFIVALLATLAAIVLAALIGNDIGRGLQRLTSTAGEIQAGNLDVRAGLDQNDELGVLGSAFDRMAGALRTMTDELREAAIDEARLRGRLEAVVGGMGEALLAVDAAGNVTDFNLAAQELFGVSVAEALGTPVSRLSLVGPGGEDLTERLSRPDGKAWASDALVAGADGFHVPVAVTGASLRGAAGERAGAVVVVRDVRHEREVDRMKTEFLANISHEMKTPLTPIKGYAQMLAERDVPPERVRDFAEEIVVGARQLERVITQLVNFATMAAGRLEPNPVVVHPRAVLDDVVSRWADRLNGGHAIQRRVARGTPDLLVDRRLLDLSLDELVDNAVKYSPDGGKVSLAATAGDDGSVLVSVADRGVGVPDDRLDMIFGDFAQGDGSSTRAFGGLGLGLPMVRHVALAHGGDLTCTSRPGRGSTFTLRLPAVQESK